MATQAATLAEAEVAGPRTEVAGLTGQPQPDLILLNDTDLGYALVRFDQQSLRTLTESIGDLSDSVARTVRWNAVLDMAQQAEPPLGKALFPNTAASPELLSQIEEFLTDPALEPALARLVTECPDVVEKALRARALPELNDGSELPHRFRSSVAGAPCGPGRLAAG